MPRSPLVRCSSGPEVKADFFQHYTTQGMGDEYDRCVFDVIESKLIVEVLAELI